MSKIGLNCPCEQTCPVFQTTSFCSQLIPRCQELNIMFFLACLLPLPLCLMYNEVPHLPHVDTHFWIGAHFMGSHRATIHQKTNYETIVRIHTLPSHTSFLALSAGTATEASLSVHPDISLKVWVGEAALEGRETVGRFLTCSWWKTMRAWNKGVEFGPRKGWQERDAVEAEYGGAIS